jgi:hypothetical protein
VNFAGPTRAIIRPAASRMAASSCVLGRGDMLDKE